MPWRLRIFVWIRDRNFIRKNVRLGLLDRHVGKPWR